MNSFDHNAAYKKCRNQVNNLINQKKVKTELDDAQLRDSKHSMKAWEVVIEPCNKQFNVQRKLTIFM